MKENQKKTIGNAGSQKIGRLLMLVIVLIGCLPNMSLPVFAVSSGATIDMSDSSIANGTSGTGWTYTDNVYTILDGADITITGTSANNRRLLVASGARATITLEGTNITSSVDFESPLQLSSGASVNLFLVGANSVTGITQAPGINTTDARLVIDGSGSLTAQGSPYWPGIGGGLNYPTGTIIINGGVINASGGECAAGIGGSWGYDGGNIEINGGVVTAQGSYGDGIGAGAGIGGGFDGSAGTFTMNGSGVVFNNSISDISQKIVASWLLGTGALSLAMSIWTKR